MRDPGAALEEILLSAVERGVAPGAQAWVWHDGSEVASASAGATRLEGGTRVSTDTLFDVASLTKPAAACLALRLAALGRISLHDPVVDEPRAGLARVLEHRAGFQAYLPLHEHVGPEAWGTTRARRSIIEAAVTAPREVEERAGTLYSDLGYIALVPLLEARARLGLEEAMRTHVTGPLGLETTGYGPLERHERTVAATEDVERRGGVIHGEVHDDNAAAMGGASAHAGLFSTAEQMGRLAVALLESARSRLDFLPAELASLAYTPPAPGGRTLVWDTRSPEGSTAGSRLGPRSVGHLGYTGCSIWTDPDESLVVVLLTNRVHPTSANESIRAFRPTFHDAVVESVLR